MTFLAGGMLWLLGLGGVVIAVYFLKRRAHPAAVSALFLWRGIEQRPKSALRLRWTQILALLLQLLALASLVAGLAQPTVTLPAQGVQTLALIVDGSASMRARLGTDGPSRYRRAAEEALGVVNANPAAEIAVIQAKARSEVLIRPTHDHGRIHRTIDGSRASYEGNAAVSDLLSLVEGLFPGRGADRVVFVTDGSLISEAASLAWESRLVGAGTEVVDVAVARFRVRPQPEGRGVAFFVEIWNSTESARTVVLQVEGDGRILEERALTLAPGSSELAFQEEFGAAEGRPSRYVARIRTDGTRDDWVSDNVHHASLPHGRPWQILWVGGEGFYLERFLERSERAELTRVADWESAPAWTPYDVVLANGVEVPVEPSDLAASGRYLVIGSSFRPWVTAKGTEKAQGLGVEVQADHPVLAGIDPTDWRLLQVSDAEVRSEGEVLLSAGGTPLLYVLRRPGLRLAYLGFDLRASNVGLSVDFPILMHNLMSWLSPRVEEASHLAAGTELPSPELEGLPEEGQAVQVVGPEGDICEPVPGDAGCGRAEQPGFYEVRNAGRIRLYAANIPSQEVRLRPQGPATTGGKSGLGGRGTRELRVRRALWPYLLMAGATLLGLELILFDRSRFLPRGARRHVRQKGRRAVAAVRTFFSRVRSRSSGRTGGRR